MDGALELVGAVRVQARRHGEIARALLVLRPGAPRPILHRRVPGDGIQVMGTMDLNGDGMDDVFTRSWGLEYGSEEAWISEKRGGYMRLLLAEGGC